MSAQTDAKHFHDEDAAREYLEQARWGGEPVCPHCGSVGDHYRLEGKKHRKGLLKCQDCREQFSVTVGTVFECSKIPLHKWLFAAYLLCSSKKGMSAHQLHRMIGVTYKTAWFLAHRIRLAMTDSGGGGLMGSGGNVVEADETYIGKKRGVKQRPRWLASQKHGLRPSRARRSSPCQTHHLGQGVQPDQKDPARERLARSASLD